MWPNYKIIGACIVPNPNAAYTPNRRFEGMWSTAWDFDGWIKPQIDYILGDCGCNTIHSIGAAWGVSSGRVDASVYSSRLVQVAEYIRSKGGMFYLRGDSIRADTDTSKTAIEMAAIHVSYLRPLEALGNLLAFDPIGEFEVGVSYFGSLSGAYGSYIRAVTGEIKSSGVSTPITWSVKYDTDGYNAAVAVADAMDFIDTHIYNFALANMMTALDSYLANTDRSILIGETGKNNTALSQDGGGDPATQASDMAKVYRLGLSGNPRILGVLQWAAADLDNSITKPITPEAGEWGIYDTNTMPGVFKARSHKVEQVRRYTRGSTALSKAI